MEISTKNEELCEIPMVVMEKPLGFATETTVIHCFEYVEGKIHFLMAAHWFCMENQCF